MASLNSYAQTSKNIKDKIVAICAFKSIKVSLRIDI
jgi:hypothetical protein